jgi:hypothetical protein
MIKKTLTLNVLSVMITKLKIGYLLKIIQIKVNAQIAREKDLTPKSSALAVKNIISFSQLIKSANALSVRTLEILVCVRPTFTKFKMMTQKLEKSELLNKSITSCIHR